MDIKKINISSYESWERSVFANTLAGHNLFVIYCATLKDIYRVFVDTKKEHRAELLPRYIRIIQTITKAANEQRSLGAKNGVQHLIDSENHAKLWILTKLLDTVYEMMTDIPPDND